MSDEQSTPVTAPKTQLNVQKADVLRSPSNVRCAQQLDAVISSFTISPNRHYKTIVRELSERQISLADIRDGSKAKGIAQMLGDDVLTMGDLVVLGQFAKAIEDGSTSAAEFLRDTAGYKPVQEVQVEQKQGSIAQLSDAQLYQLLEALQPEPASETGEVGEQR